MSLGESMNSRSYEVRCASCDVSFPVETKRCVHCGGSTGSGRIVSFSTRASTNTSADYSTNYSSDEETFESAYGMDGEDFVFRDETGSASSSSDAGDRANPVSAANPEAGESSSPIKSLIRSMGGVIWILLLVGFSLARSCGGE